MKKRDYEENKQIYKLSMVSKRISFLLIEEQEKFGLNQLQMAQKLDMPLPTYKRLISPKNKSIIGMENLAKIFVNCKISPSDVFDDIYK